MTTPAGWYDDGQGSTRWWDGAQWTAHVQEAAPQQNTLADQASPGYDASASTIGAPMGEYGSASTQVQPSGLTVDPLAGAVEDHKSVPWWLILSVVGVAAVAGFAAISFASNPSADPADLNVAVMEYDTAWKTGDCDLLDSVTTRGMRDASGIGDCTSFQSESAAFMTGLESYDVEITSTTVGSNGTSGTVVATETYTTTDGASSDEYTYELANVGGDWKISDVN